MALTFPTTPAVGDTYPAAPLANGNQWEWNGAMWALRPSKGQAPPPAELPGLGGWAEISDAPTSTYTDGAGVGWNVWTFTANGVLNISKEGLVDALICGAGSGSNDNGAGGGGGVRDGLVKLPAGAAPVTIGQSGGNQTQGGSSLLGTISAGGGLINPNGAGGGGGTSDLNAGYAGGGAGGSRDPNRTTPGPGVFSSISGTLVEYGRGGTFGVAASRPGEGAKEYGSGMPGVVIRQEARLMEDATEVAAAVAIGFAAIGLGLVGFGWLLYRSGRLKHPAPIIIAVSMLTLVALVLGVLEASAEAITLAATGMGALAGALSSIYKDGGNDDGATKGDEDDAAA